MAVCVGIVDDYRAMLIGTTAIIHSHPGFHVVAAGRTIGELVSFRQRMDVILLDLSLSDGSTAPQNIAALSWTGAAVLVHAGNEPLTVLRQAAHAGAVGMIDKTEEAPHIMATLKAAARGQLVAGVDWTVEIEREEQMPPRVVLTVREAEVLTRYAAGETAEKVAQALFVTRETVLDHVRRIRQKYAAVGRPAVTKIDLFRRASEDGYVRTVL